MKEFLNDTLELDEFLENNLEITKDYIDEMSRQSIDELLVKKPVFFERTIKRLKKTSEFSSLDRIRIVVDGLIGDINEKELCRREGISLKTYVGWRDFFLEAFKKYSEIEVLQKALTSKNKELISKGVGLEACKFYAQFIEIDSIQNLVVSKDRALSSFSDFSEIKNLILLNKVNNFRQINKQLEEVNQKLPYGGILMGNFETFRSRSRKKFINNIPVLKQVYEGFDFLLNRVCPKLPFVKKIYFSITKGKNRLLSKAEALGRLVSCGFDILDYKEIDGIHYFASIKIK